MDPGETSTVTGLGGAYSFVGLAPGVYRVAEVHKDGWTQTHPPGGSHKLTLTVGQEERGVRFGNMELAQIHGVKFDDRDGDGVRDPGEPGLSGWTMYLDSNGNGVLDPGEPSTTTDAIGGYWFMDLTPGTYQVAEVSQDRWQQTAPEFVALLNGESQAPPVATGAFGFARFSLDDESGMLSFDVWFDGVSSDTAGLGLHRGRAGENGPVVHDLAAAAAVQRTEFGSPVSGQVGLSAQEMDDLGQGNLYVNLSTADFALGEIRGQIVSSTAHLVIATSGTVVEDRDFGNTRTIRTTFSITDVTVDESVGVATLTVTLDPPVTTSAMTVEYATLDGTALAPDDYEATSSTATVSAGQPNTTVTVPIVDDSLDEPDETFVVHLSNPAGGAEIDPAMGSATVTILASDVAAPSFDPASQVQLDPGGIVVTWATAGEHDGHVEWALSAAELAASPAVAADARGPLSSRLNRRTHRVEVRGIAAGSTVHYNVVTGGVAHPDGPFQAIIPSTALNEAPRGISGSVTYSDGAAGTECLVYLQVRQPGLGESLVINTMTNGGRYSAEVGNLRLVSNIDAPLGYDADGLDATITVTALCGSLNVGVVSRTTAAASKLFVVGRVSEYTGMDVEVAPAVEEQVPLATGQNLITLPVAPIGGLTAVGLAQQVGEQGGEVAQVSRWDESRQMYTIWRPGTADFELEVGAAYFVLVVEPPADGVWRVSGRRIATPAPLQLVVGLNLIGVPVATPAGGYDTASLVQAIGAQGGTAVQIVGWDARTQTFVLWSAASPGANVSPIEDQVGYFVLVTDASGSAFEP